MRFSVEFPAFLARAERKIITINYPCKGHLPGPMPVKAKLLAMLDRLPRKNETVFATTYRGIANSYLQIRRQVAQQLHNPRILKISFAAFRHWVGRMIAYYANGNMLGVKKMLRHKAITSSMKYVGTINFEDSEFETATATTVDEAKKLAEADFQKFDEFNSIHIYRRPKRFQH
jgi:integrase